MRTRWGHRGQIAVLLEVVAAVRSGHHATIGRCSLGAYQVAAAEAEVRRTAVVAAPGCIHIVVVEVSVGRRMGHSCCIVVVHILVVVVVGHSSAGADNLGEGRHIAAAVGVGRHRRSCCGIAVPEIRMTL